MTEKHVTNNRDRQTTKYRRLHLMLQLECSLAAIEKEPTKQARKAKASEEFRIHGE